MSAATWFCLLYLLPAVICAVYVGLLGLRKPKFPWLALALCPVPVFNLVAALILALILVVFLVVVLIVSAAAFVHEGLKS